MLRRLHTTLLIAAYSLFPKVRQQHFGAPKKRWQPDSSPDHFLVQPEEIAGCLGNLSHLLSKEGRLALFFPNGLALAAPFLLFRLKREGYSNCRAWSEAGGLAVTADR